MTIAESVRSRTLALLRDLYVAAPEGVRGDVETIGLAYRAGEVSAMGVTDRLAPLLRRWPAGLEVAGRHLPMWAWWVGHGEGACTAQG